MKELSKCVGELIRWWEDVKHERRISVIKNGHVLYFLFTSVEQFLSQIRGFEKSILLNLPKEAWEHLLKSGKGRDFLWEMEEFYRQEDPGDLKERRKSLILNIRDFLKAHDYTEEQLGKPPWE